MIGIKVEGKLRPAFAAKLDEQRVELLAWTMAEVMNGGQFKSSEFYNGDQREVWLQRARDILSIVDLSSEAELSRADLPAAVTVKPLEWSKFEHDPTEQEYVSLTLTGKYFIGFGMAKGKRYVEYNGEALANEQGVIWFDYLKEAKAAAQADCKRRILSQIALTPVAGWRKMDDPELKKITTAGEKVDLWVPEVGRITNVVHPNAYAGVTHWRPLPAAPDAAPVADTAPKKDRGND